jgi:hypothetical protein
MNEKPARICTWRIMDEDSCVVGICVKPASRDMHGTYYDIPCEFLQKLVFPFLMARHAYESCGPHNYMVTTLDSYVE